MIPPRFDRNSSSQDMIAPSVRSVIVLIISLMLLFLNSSSYSLIIYAFPVMLEASTIMGTAYF